ncbi:MAG: hypothetical protein QOH17_2592 [Pseudonocardiales bacterium]|jgi:hypothetical protein|nr:hypothetical protein [Pseudonocardiales bacterium]
MTSSTQCRCGHVAEAHEHFQPGNECGVCRCGHFSGVSRPDASPSGAVANILLTVFAPLRFNPRRT